MIEEDIRIDRCYAGICDGNSIHCVFASITGEDPAYLKIDRAWLNDEPYTTVHRIASDGRYHGLFKECMDYLQGKMR